MAEPTRAEERSHEAKCNVFPHMQTCPRPGCSSHITWREVTEAEPNTKPLRPMRTIKLRFKQCCDCAATEWYESAMFRRKRSCRIVKRTEGLH